MLQTSIYKILIICSVGSVFVPIICCFLKFKTLKTVLRVLFFYLIISALTELLNPLVAKTELNYYYALQNIFTIIEFLLLAALYYLMLSDKLQKKILLIIAVAFVLLSCIVFFVKGNYDSTDNLIKPIESSLMILVSIAYYFRVLRALIKGNIQSEDYYFTFINAAILTYFASSFLIFLFGPYLENCPRKLFQIIWSLNLIANIYFNSLLALGIWKQKT